MRATAILGPRSSGVIEVPIPEPGPGEALVRVRAAGVCASERPLWDHHDSGAPVRLGHEFAGEIVASGAGVHGWAEGTRVTGFAGPTFAEYVLVRAADLFAVPDHVPDVAALGEPVACVLEAVSRSGLRPGDRVAVVGVGFMGLIAVQALRAAGAAEVVAVDLRANLYPTALALGADRAERTDEIADAERSAFDVVVELTGTAGGLTTAGALVRAHGTLCVAGYHHEGRRDLDVDWWYRGLTLVNGFSPSRERQREGLRAGLALMAQRRLTLEPLITDVHGLDGLDAAYARAPGRIKAVLVP